MASLESAPAAPPPPPVTWPAPAPATTTTTTTSAAPASSSPAAAPSVAAAPRSAAKPVHVLVLDTAPLIKNDPPVSSLLAQADVLVTIPAVLDEVRDPATRARVDTMLRAFLTLRTPTPASIKFVSDFARRTGDLEVLSRPDLHLLALTYELECETNGGDWRLRRTPTQVGLNGKPKKESAAAAAAAAGETDAQTGTADTCSTGAEQRDGPQEKQGEEAQEAQGTQEEAQETQEAAVQEEQQPDAQPLAGLEEKVGDLVLEAVPAAPAAPAAEANDDEEAEPEVEEGDEKDDDDEDSDGDWITPSNLKKHQEKERTGGVPAQPIQTRMQTALLTGDFAMQNVALRINLNVLSPGGTENSSGLARITHVKTWVLRCHGCFAVTRQMDKQFCPACGQATLTRTSCSTDAATGRFRVHLKRNFQYNKRGNVFSVPKPVHGSASGKYTDAMKRSGAGGAQGWGRELILSEDQREYTKRAEEQARTRVRDMMDEDYLPNLLTGARSGGSGRIKVGAGRNVNAKKRR